MSDDDRKAALRAALTNDPEAAALLQEEVNDAVAHALTPHPVAEVMRAALDRNAPVTLTETPSSIVLDPDADAEAMGAKAYADGLPSSPGRDNWTPFGAPFRRGWEKARIANRRKIAADLTAAVGAFLKEWSG